MSRQLLHLVYEDFYDLCHVKYVPPKSRRACSASRRENADYRKCIRCGRKFLSMGKGNRRCAKCEYGIEKQSFRRRFAT